MFVKYLCYEFFDIKSKNKEMFFFYLFTLLANRNKTWPNNVESAHDVNKKHTLNIIFMFKQCTRVNQESTLNMFK